MWRRPVSYKSWHSAFVCTLSLPETASIFANISDIGRSQLYIGLILVNKVLVTLDCGRKSGSGTDFSRFSVSPVSIIPPWLSVLIYLGYEEQAHWWPQVRDTVSPHQHEQQLKTFWLAHCDLDLYILRHVTFKRNYIIGKGKITIFLRRKKSLCNKFWVKIYFFHFCIFRSILLYCSC
jgi:hypothetical protein